MEEDSRLIGSIQSSHSPIPRYSSNLDTTAPVYFNDVPIYTEEFPPYEHAGRSVAAGGTPKDVNFLESLCYAFVQNYGFAILGVPLVFQQAGLPLTTLVFLVLSLIANWAPLLLTEAQSMIPGNEKFKLDIEYIGIVRYYFGKIGYWTFQIIINVYILAVNIAAIRVSSQAVDSFIILAAGHTFGLEFYPHAGGKKIPGPNDWYGDNLVLGIPLAYVILAVLLIPLSFMQLKSNIKVQIVSCIIVGATLGVFIWDFTKHGYDVHNVPMKPSNVNQLIGVFIFSLAYASMIPSWVNQKKESVSPNKVIWITGGIVSLLNYVIPLLAAYSYGNLNGDDVFQVMTASGSKVTKAAVYAYTLAVITTSVPVYSVTVKNNLYVTGATGWKTAVFISIVVPWSISWIFNSGAAFATLLNAASLFCGGFTGFFVPIALYMKAQQKHVKSFGKPSNNYNVLPKWLLPHWKAVGITLLALTVIPTIAQIIIDIIYFAHQHKNPTPSPTPGAPHSIAPITGPWSPVTTPPLMGPTQLAPLRLN